MVSRAQFEYFAEGRAEDPAVFCFASAGFNVSSLMPPKPIPGLYVVLVNQFGHGNSSPLDRPLVFSEVVPDVIELVDELKIDKFYTCGHSCGGVWAMQIAAAHPDRVIGVAVISSPGCLRHPSISKSELKKIGGMGAVLGSPGCMGSLVRKMMVGSYYHPDKTADFGFAGHSNGGYSYYKCKATGGAPKAMESDHFFVTKMLDAELHGANTKMALVNEMHGIYSPQPWSYDIANIKCPSFLYVEVEGEVPESYMELNTRLIPGAAELVKWDAHGHVSIVMEFVGIVTSLVQGKSFAGDYGAKGS